MVDITIAEDPHGQPIAHRPDCPQVADARAHDRMVLTMFEVAVGLEVLECIKHSCLANGDDQEL